jgi:hypothetical protein
LRPAVAVAVVGPAQGQPRVHARRRRAAGQPVEVVVGCRTTCPSPNPSSPARRRSAPRLCLGPGFGER